MVSQEKGICRLSIVPVRKDPDDRSEMVTQLLFGDHYSVTTSSKNKNWIRVTSAFDDYSGWIDIQQHYPISPEHFQEIEDLNYRICIDLVNEVLFRKNKMLIVIGSIIPVSGTELFDNGEHFAFNGESKNLGQKRDFDFLRTIALKYLNTPYLWGGKTPFGIDCSGFVQMVYKIAGYRLKRDANQQVNQGSQIKSFSQIRPGDLAFFTRENEKVSHTGIILEGHKIIHASGQVRVDILDEKGIFNDRLNVYTHNLHSIRRILK